MEEAEDVVPFGCFSSFCTRRWSLEVSEVCVEVVGDDEEGEDAEGFGNGGNGNGS